MKIIFAILGAAILISSGIMIFLVKKGAALRPAGVIAPSEIGTRAELIGQAVGLRLFPDFQTAKNVVWYLDVTDEPFVNIPESTLASYQTNFKPELFDLRKIKDCHSQLEKMLFFLRLEQTYQLELIFEEFLQRYSTVFCVALRIIQ